MGPEVTFDELWTRAGLDTDADPSSTVERRASAPPVDTAALPRLHLDTRHLTLENRLGEGGMGVVDAVRDHTLERTVAMKRPRPGSGPAVAAALVAEAKVLAALDHPNVVPTHALVRDASGDPALLMKRVRGRPWSELVGTVDLDRHLRIAHDVAVALAFAHGRGWLHRDVKPDNVMVGEYGEVYLMDWGCACRLEGAVTVDLVGTPAHLAPEMARVRSRLSPATDVYLVGATLLRVLTGRNRHTGHDVRAVLRAAAEDIRPEYPPDFPQEVIDLIERACAFRAEERHPTATALAEAIDALTTLREAGRMVEAARARLGELEDAVARGDPQAEVAFAECRFACRHALERWPGHPDAAASLARAWRAWAPWKLGAGEPDTVAALLDEAPVEQRRRWAELVEAARAQRAARERERRDWDLREGLELRRRYAIRATLAMGALAVSFAIYRGSGPVTSTNLLALAAGALAFTSVLLVVGGRQVLDTAASRGLFLGGVWVCVSSVIVRLLGWALGLAPGLTLRADALAFGAVVSVYATIRDRRLLFAAVPYFVAAAVLTVAPAVDAPFPIATMVAFGVLLWTYLRPT